MKQTLINRSVAIAILVLPLLLLGGIPSAAGQENPGKEVPVRDLLKQPGKLVGEAKLASPTGDLKLTGYRVEEVQLSRSLSVEVQGRQTVVNRAWRIAVQGGPFPVRAMPAVIWIDDQIVGNAIENETLSQITAVTFDGSLIREGAEVSISYGDDKSARVKFAPRLKLQREGGNQ
jgi:hypothetical protein